MLGFLEASAAQVPESHLVEAAHVVGVAAQRLLIVVEGRPCGVAVLFQVQARQVELVARLALDRRQGSLSRIGDGAHLIGLGMPGKEGHSHVGPFLVTGYQRRLFAADVECEVAQLGVSHVHHLRQHLLGRERHYLIIIVLAVGRQHQLHPLLRRGQHLEANAIPLVFSFYLIFYTSYSLILVTSYFLNIENKVLRGLLDHAQLAIGHEVLRELLLFVGHQPREVRLVLGVDTRHQFDVGAETRT